MPTNKFMELPKMSGTCSFTAEDATPCKRPPIQGEPFCSLHLGCNDKPGEEVRDNPYFEGNFTALVAAKDGNWRGFVFPPGIKLPSELDFEIDARECQFHSLSISRTIFKGTVDFSGSSFNEITSLKGVIFENKVFFVQCNFNGEVTISNVKCLDSASFLGSNFTGRTILNINYSRDANLNQVIFHDGVKFSGWRNVNLSFFETIQLTSSFQGTVANTAAQGMYDRIRIKITEIRNQALVWSGRIKKKVIAHKDKLSSHLTSLKRQYAKSDPSSETFRMFELEGQLQDVVFLKPDQTIFSQVDISKVYFRGTNLRGIRFLGTNWWQPKLGRNGLRDELFIRLNKDGVFRHENLPVLEDTCRNARVALEDNKSFDTASDFYIAEMEASREQLGFIRREFCSITALYRFVSFYGTSVGVAVRIFLLFLCLHLLLTIAIQYLNGDPFEETVRNEFLNSFKVLFQLSPDRSNVSASYGQSWIDIVFRVLGLVQIAMVALAFRSRIKRH